MDDLIKSLANVANTLQAICGKECRVAILVSEHVFYRIYDYYVLHDITKTITKNSAIDFPQSIDFPQYGIKIAMFQGDRSDKNNDMDVAWMRCPECKRVFQTYNPHDHEDIVSECEKCGELFSYKRNRLSITSSL